MTGIDNVFNGLIKPLQGFIEIKFFLLVLTLKTSSCYDTLVILSGWLRLRVTGQYVMLVSTVSELAMFIIVELIRQ